jgi:hypothetical protein
MVGQKPMNDDSWKRKVKGWLKKFLLRVSSDGDGRISDSARRKSAVQGIGHQQSPTDCWPFARAYVTLLQ